MSVAQFEQFASQHFNISVKTGNEWMVRCIFHDDSNASMQFNVEKGLFICFACGAKGSHKSIERQLGVRFVEGEIDLYELRKKIALVRRDPEEPVNLPESWLDRYKFETDYWGPHNSRCTRKCNQHRDLYPETIAGFDLGYDPIGGYVTIPVRNMSGGLLGAIRRFLDPDAELRYRYPKGFKRSSNLFASWLIAVDEEIDTVVMTEGSIDAMKVWQAAPTNYGAAACFGNSISASQIRVLKRLGVKRVVMFPDNDDGGRDLLARSRGFHPYQRAREKRWQYHPETDLTRDFLVQTVSYDRRDPKDPGALTDSRIASMLRKSRSVI